MKYQFVDCRFDLHDSDRGEKLFSDGHVPGASFLDLERDLSDMKTAPAGGRHPLPSAEGFAKAASGAGIEAGVHVIAYDDGSLAGAARLWWLLRHFGHDDTTVLGGGIGSWLGELARGPAEPVSAQFGPRERSDDLIDADELHERLGDERLALLDARAPERYLGESEPLDPPAGHIPGALNVPFSQLASGGAIPASVRQLPEIVAYCGSGVTACVVLHALARQGRRDARLYPGSYSEWTRRGLPVE